MTNANGAKISRRRLLSRAPLAIGLVASGATITGPAFAQTKVSHKLAKYQDTPNGGHQCSTCAQFLPPSACKLVDSPITPHGWCQFYTPKST